MDILIGTGILWLLTALIVDPVAKALSKASRNEQQNLGEQVREGVKPMPEIDTGYYILVDVIVLGIVGFLLGRISGWFFIGVSFNPKGWPGMIAFIAGSLLGTVLYE